MAAVTFYSSFGISLWLENRIDNSYFCTMSFMQSNPYILYLWFANTNSQASVSAQWLANQIPNNTAIIQPILRLKRIWTDFEEGIGIA